MDLVRLAEHVVSRARADGLRLVTAESCSAGALSTLLADVPGAGDVLEGGFVSYSKTFKSEVLAVNEATLDRESAVCGAVPIALARGALVRSRGADVAVALTGVCGPKPDEDGNPVGLAFVAVADRTGKTLERRLDLGFQNQGHLRGQMLAAALELALHFLD